MINPIASGAVQAPDAAQARSAAPTAQPAAQAPQDKVQLSPQALSSGDVDHDGDSH